MIRATLADTKTVLQQAGLQVETVYLGFVPDEDYPQYEGVPNGREFHAIVFRNQDNKLMAWAEQLVEVDQHKSYIGLILVPSEALPKHKLVIFDWMTVA